LPNAAGNALGENPNEVVMASRQAEPGFVRPSARSPASLGEACAASCASRQREDVRAEVQQLRCWKTVTASSSYEIAKKGHPGAFDDGQVGADPRDPQGSLTERRVRMPEKNICEA